MVTSQICCFLDWCPLDHHHEHTLDSLLYEYYINLIACWKEKYSIEAEKKQYSCLINQTYRMIISGYTIENLVNSPVME